MPLPKLFMLKLLGRNEKRREERRESLGASEFFLSRLKLGRRLSVDALGVACPFGFWAMAFFMLTGGYLRSLFSFGVGAAAASC